MYNDIKVFAADHRSNVDWNLPYIRLGNCQSDSSLKITTVPVLWHKQLGEIAQAIDIKNRQKEFGSPDYLGLCHYRRFFTIALGGNKSLYDLNEDEFKPQMCCTPMQQIALLKKYEADMICFVRIKSYKKEDEDKIHNVADELENYGKRININMSRQQLDLVFDSFYKNLPTTLKEHFAEAMKSTLIHGCNIFTAKAQIFCDWASAVEATYKDCKEKFDNDGVRHSFNPRWFGYIAERLTSIYIDCCKMSGAKKIFLPLLAINSTIHKENKQRTY